MCYTDCSHSKGWYQLRTVVHHIYNVMALYTYYFITFCSSTPHSASNPHPEHMQRNISLFSPPISSIPCHALILSPHPHNFLPYTPYTFTLVYVRIKMSCHACMVLVMDIIITPTVHCTNVLPPLILYTRASICIMEYTTHYYNDFIRLLTYTCSS